MDTRSAYQARWNAAIVPWTDMVFSALAEHAIEVGKGDRGVLFVPIDAQDMETMLALKAAKQDIAIASTSTWVPIQEFLRIIREHYDDQTVWKRWEAPLETMDPCRDVALYCSSKPESHPEGRTFSRLLIAAVLPAPVH